MREITRTPLEDIRMQEKKTEAKEAQLQSLGFSLAQEKLKNAQKDSQMGSLGQQLAQIRIELAQMKGAVEK